MQSSGCYRLFATTLLWVSFTFMVEICTKSVAHSQAHVIWRFTVTTWLKSLQSYIKYIRISLTCVADSPVMHFCEWRSPDCCHHGQSTSLLYAACACVWTGWCWRDQTLKIISVAASGWISGLSAGSAIGNNSGMNRVTVETSIHRFLGWLGLCGYFHFKWCFCKTNAVPAWKCGCGCEVSSEMLSSVTRTLV